MGTLLAGYMSGKWKALATEEEYDGMTLPFQIKDANTMVSFEGKNKPLLEVAVERRAEKPDAANVAYYEVLDRPMDDGP